MTDTISISLYELAYGCHLYSATTRFDASLEVARQALLPVADLMDRKHRDAVLHFLRAWGCRHLAMADHEHASEALRSWAQEHVGDLPELGRSLEELGEEQLEAIARAFATLAATSAGRHARFGPVAAAKTLFLLRPHICPPWDNAIRERLGCDDSAVGYQRYLGEVRRLVSMLANEARVPASELPRLVGRDRSSAAELVDEYLWVRREEAWHPPSLEVLGRWTAWAQGKQPK